MRVQRFHSIIIKVELEESTIVRNKAGKEVNNRRRGASVGMESMGLGWDTFLGPQLSILV